jgi:hypothetical protein
LLTYEPFTNSVGSNIVGVLNDGFGFTTNWTPQAANNNSVQAYTTNIGLRAY